MNGCRVRLRNLMLLAVAYTAVVVCANAQNLKARVDGEHLRVSAPGLHFLTGRALERLHDGSTMTYRLLLTIRSDRAGRVLARVLQRFTVSYDLWEEKFAVTRLDSPARSVSNLSDSKAEAWCLDNLAIPIADVPADREFWMRLEYETEDGKASNPSVTSPITLGSLIDIFSRRAPEEQSVRGFDEVGPIRLADLKRK